MRRPAVIASTPTVLVRVLPEAATRSLICRALDLSSVEGADLCDQAGSDLLADPFDVTAWTDPAQQAGGDRCRQVGGGHRRAVRAAARGVGSPAAPCFAPGSSGTRRAMPGHRWCPQPGVDGHRLAARP